METQTNLLQISIQSPDLNLPSKSLLANPATTTLRHLKLSLFPPHLLPTPSPQTLSSLFFTFNGKPLLDSSTLLDSHVTAPLSTLTLRLRARGGGGDGGATGAESRDCYLNMYRDKKPDKVDPNETRLSRWTTCALSSEPLKPPCVVDGLGSLFNKVSVVEGLLKKKLPRELGHVKGLRDLISIHLAGEDGEGFRCPVSGLEFNGKYRFYALRGCGHVLSAKALKEVRSSGNCLVCQREYSEADDMIPINGSAEEVAALRERMEAEREANKKKKEKKVKGNGNVQLSGTKHGVNEKVEGDKSRAGNASGTNNGGVKRIKSGVVVPPNATEEVYASIFTSSKKSEFKETFMCRALPLGRN